MAQTQRTVPPWYTDSGAPTWYTDDGVHREINYRTIRIDTLNDRDTCPLWNNCPVLYGPYTDRTARSSTDGLACCGWEDGHCSNGVAPIRTPTG